MRTRVGICDVSTLGKIDISGPDAAAFLDRVYVNTFSTLGVGQGALRADAARGRLRARRRHRLPHGASTHFVTTTTTAHAERVLEHLHFCHQVLWPQLDVAIIPVTEQWAQIAVAGPRARDVLGKIIDTGDISQRSAALHGGGRDRDRRRARGGCFACRSRASLPTRSPCRCCTANALMCALMQAGAEFGITPYGTEALNVLRIEKGHVSGPEIDGRTTARDLGLGKLVSGKKDCIGRVMSGRPALLAPDRPILVGLEALNSNDKLSAGAHLIALGRPKTAEQRRRARQLGRVLAVARARDRARVPEARRRAHRRTHPRGRSAARPRRLSAASSSRCSSIPRESGCVAKTILIQRSPVHIVAGRYGARGDAPDGVVLTVREGLAIAMIAARNGKRAQIDEALERVAGVRPPNDPKCVVQGEVVLIGIAPEQWLAVAEGSRAGGFIPALSEALGDAASVTDHSSARTVIRVAGKRARDTLAKGCAIDLHPRVFTAGSAATTRFAHIGGILWQPEPAQAYDIAVPSSLARSFWSWLTASAGEYGYTVAV